MNVHFQSNHISILKRFGVQMIDFFQFCENRDKVQF